MASVKWSSVKSVHLITNKNDQVLREIHVKYVSVPHAMYECFHMRIVLAVILGVMK